VNTLPAFTGSVGGEHSWGGGQPLSHSWGGSQPLSHSWGGSQPLSHSWGGSQPLPPLVGGSQPLFPIRGEAANPSPTRGGGWEGESAITPTPDAAHLYLRRYLDFFPANILAGMRLGFYEHSSVARDLLRDILEGLGAQVISLGRTDQFVPIDTEAVAEVDIRRAQAWAAEHRFDAILSTDGDADRPLLGDENGNWLRGDVAGILCAQFLGARAVATPVSSNTALEQCGAFERIARTRIGSPFVIAAMEQLAAEGATNIVGFEANGGFLLGSRLEKAGRVLEPLPTRDAVLPILALLAMARERGVPVSRLAAGLPPRFTASDRVQNFPTENSRALLQALAGSAATLAEFLSPLGLAAAGLDQTDGLRITLASGEILHLRPSGNAPELRCYAEAESQERANELAKAGLGRVGSWRG
jgi:phosphomannomutase